jgi:GTP-binding protein
MEKMLDRWEELPPYFVTSSEKAIGREELLDYIGNLNSEPAADNV